jgi:hypothetical protein
MISMLSGMTFRESGMTSHSLANALGWIVLVVALGAAVFYGPLGQFGKQPPAQTQTAQPAKPAVPAAPPVKGPVIREVPN